ncbi:MULTISPECIES: TlpA disulfide reductase family protein [unclassified Undibacterium]|uniref:TlpA family protein disulfide reductase n=1 Tax=unclassified Undibacterium TaxID=2630295 RepID=UPI002AC9A36A|nr:MULTISPECIES: TlpA disulfide reductase family protein [unclassified Undibacterium]MEB0137653.1 TlpA disulfide reductase family protein [Undibacterium sp. CCC2.1]MEB0174281.1 TlpA disulfide reductase family protein [Undibacterium sp. CCC1.1]MEB0177397.1 TlpA disulfide reductase family protein [Undibacterium sp. CCC3.4]MEB0215490.1 TlpA disulfide reductase family protein [Undibacterium sp. 5I2]WPX42229.1 TlpA disulfide reductase family protein [Undibacterium sp. CCC3.4]
MLRRNFIQSSLVGGLLLSSAAIFAKPGATAYSLQGTDVYGKKLNLLDFSGMTVLVSFFTVDCAPCSEDLKLMREFYVRNSKNKFMLLGVNLDKSKADLDEYNELTTQAYPKDQRFPTVWRNAPGHQDSFGFISKQPTHFVLDQKGQLKFKREGKFLPEDWDQLWLSL